MHNLTLLLLLFSRVADTSNWVPCPRRISSDAAGAHRQTWVCSLPHPVRRLKNRCITHLSPPMDVCHWKRCSVFRKPYTNRLYYCWLKSDFSVSRHYPWTSSPISSTDLRLYAGVRWILAFCLSWRNVWTLRLGSKWCSAASRRSSFPTETISICSARCSSAIELVPSWVSLHISCATQSYKIYSRGDDWFSNLRRCFFLTVVVVTCLPRYFFETDSKGQHLEWRKSAIAITSRKITLEVQLHINNLNEVILTYLGMRKRKSRLCWNVCWTQRFSFHSIRYTKCLSSENLHLYVSATNTHIHSNSIIFIK